LLGSDYLLEINADSFVDWVLNRFFSYLEGSISNTICHSVVKDKLPNSSCTNIGELLQMHGVEYDPLETVPELHKWVELC
jgi:hypothetical protein